MSPTDVSDSLVRPRSNSSAKSLLVTILGEFVQHQGGSVWTKTLVDSLGILGLEERNARQAIARLKSQDIIVVEHLGRVARWTITESGGDLLRSGAKRIFGFGLGSQDWDGRWLLVHCSIPEAQRSKRHQFRSRLAFEGFGFISPTVAISPNLDSETEANAVIIELGLVESAIVLRCESGSIIPDTDIGARTWDLLDLSSDYEAFMDEFAGYEPTEPGQAFCAVVRLVHWWRRFPFIDPELPAQLLPENWIGRRARALFDDSYAAWKPAADDWYLALERSSTAPDQ
ncbi:MAG: PaaX family transcriptional regulator C-terminal domain-containing protein [Acidimicrobiales bacterium]